MEAALILARTSDGKLWQAVHFGEAPAWTWRSSSRGQTEIMGHLVLTIDERTALPTNPGEVTAAMLPGAAGEGVTHP